MDKNIIWTHDYIEQMTRYRQYVENHISAVKRSHHMFKQNFKILFPNVYNNHKLITQLLYNINIHDQSKFDSNEVYYYAKRFFPIKGIDDPDSEEVKNNFDIAWLHHIHNNPHHPDHWVLFDKDNTKIFDMQDIYIIEMLCDWYAMSVYHNTKVIDYWKSESGQKLPMSDNTKAKVNECIESMHYSIKDHTLW